MAYSQNPKAPGAPPGPPGAALSPEEAERLAAMFRPSWELDDAPFTGAGTLTAEDVAALQGGGTFAEVRVAMEPPVEPVEKVGSRPPPRANVEPEPEMKVIIDDSVATSPPAAAAPVADPVRDRIGPHGTLVLPVVPAPAEEVAVAATAVVAAPQPLGTEERRLMVAEAKPTWSRAEPPGVDAVPIAPRGSGSRAPLWIGLGLGGAAVAGALIWWTASPSASAPQAREPPVPSAATATVSSAPSQAKTPVAAATPSATPAAEPGPKPPASEGRTPPPEAPQEAAQSGQSSGPSSVQSAHAAVSAAATPTPRAVAAAPTPRAPVAAAQGGPAKTHAKSTIVRDVPF